MNKQVFKKTIMFLPHEASYLAALEKYPDLDTYASKKNVIFVGPGNLLEAIVYKSTAEGVMEAFLLSEIEINYMEELRGIFLGHDLNSNYSWGSNLEFAILRLAYLSGIVGYLVTLAIFFFPLFLYKNDIFPSKL